MMRNLGAQIADPAAMGDRKVIKRGRFWKEGARAIPEATMDWMEPAEPARGGIINARVDNLTLNKQPLLVGYAGTPITTGGAQTFTGSVIPSNLTTTSMAGTMTVPKVTYSYSAKSKSYSPAGMLAK